MKDKKYRIFFLITTLLLFFIFIILNYYEHYMKRTFITYNTSIEEMNRILNESNKNYNINNEDKYTDNIRIKIENRDVIFNKKSVLISADEYASQRNYHSTINTISILEVYTKNEYTDKNYLFHDEMNIPVFTTNYNGIKIFVCDNLSNYESRNFYYYDVDEIDHKVCIRCTRATELFFYYNNHLYYVGIDVAFDQLELENLINQILSIDI